jgi:hypothetical protein
MPAEVHAAHPAGLIQMGERALQALPAKPQRALAACPGRLVLPQGTEGRNS